jgi:hypothetical protein
MSISKKMAPGYYADGVGLYLQVTDAGAKSWIYRYMLAKRRREMGLGALAHVSLAQARAKANAARQLHKAVQAVPATLASDLACADGSDGGRNDGPV